METGIDCNIIAYHFQPLHLLFCKWSISSTTYTSLVSITFKYPFLITCSHHVSERINLWYLLPFVLDYLDNVNQFFQYGCLASHFRICREYHAFIKDAVVSLHSVVKLMYHGFGYMTIAIILMIDNVKSCKLILVSLNKLF